MKNKIIKKIQNFSMAFSMAFSMMFVATFAIHLVWSPFTIGYVIGGSAGTGLACGLWYTFFDM